MAGWGTATLLLLTVGWTAFGRCRSAADIVDSLPVQLVNIFESTGGRHPGFRRNHAKGICVSGHFDSSGAAAAISSAPLLQAGSMPVIGRFSLGGGNPAMLDDAADVRGMGLRIEPPNGQGWYMALNSVPVFVVRTPQEFLARMRAMRPDPRTGEPDPARALAFERAHPASRAFQDWVDSHPPSSGYENADYYSVSTFRFIDAHGKVREARWRFAAESPYQPMTGSMRRDPDFLSFNLQQRLAQGPARWHLLISLALPGDPVNDATRLWSDVPERIEIDAGTLVIDKAESQIDGPCRDIDFDPLELPEGIEPSDDPLLRVREATYHESFQRRMQEQQH